MEGNAKEKESEGEEKEAFIPSDESAPEMVASASRFIASSFSKYFHSESFSMVFLGRLHQSPFVGFDGNCKLF